MSWLGPKVPYGSLLKGAKLEKAKKSDPRKREVDEKHLEFVRKLPCIAGGKGAIEAAHVRMASAAHDKPITGMGTKPSDRWALPLAKTMHERQHAIGEELFWAEVGIDPLDLCVKLYAISGDVKAGKRLIASARAAARPLIAKASPARGAVKAEPAPTLKTKRKGK